MECMQSYTYSHIGYLKPLSAYSSVVYADMCKANG